MPMAKDCLGLRRYTADMHEVLSNKFQIPIPITLRLHDIFVEE